jgi:SAM-dependent methyltransferase
MYSPDVVMLKQFYASMLGEQVAMHLGQTIQTLWPDAGNDTMLGLGYVTPYLEHYRDSCLQIVNVMLPEQGVMYWPSDAENESILANESNIPIADNMMNRMLVVHALEHTEYLRGMMEECWRVLTPGGRALLVVPNRRGAWSRAPKSPFAYGQPYSLSQLERLVEDAGFTKMRTRSALFFLPLDYPLLEKIMPWFEKIGNVICPFFGGVLLMEIEKQIYAMHPKRMIQREEAVHIPAAKPAMNRVNRNF